MLHIYCFNKECFHVLQRFKVFINAHACVYACVYSVYVCTVRIVGTPQWSAAYKKSGFATITDGCVYIYC